MAKLRDQLMIAIIFSAVEAYVVLHYAPDWKPKGGLGRLAEWFMIGNVVCLMSFRWFVYPFLLSPLRHLPGPKGGNLLIGHGAAQFSKPPGAKLLKMVDEVPNDGLIRFRSFFNQEVVLPTTHETLKTVLSDHPYDYEKPAPFVNILRKILGDGLILVEGNVHKFQRKHLMPSFQLRHIKALYPMFWAKSCELTNIMAPEDGVADPKGFELEFGQWCMRATLDIIGFAGFGRDFGSLTNPHDELVESYHQVLEPDNEKLAWFALSVIFPGWLIGLIPWKINTELNRIQKQLYEFAVGMVRERRVQLADSKASSADTKPSGTAVNATDAGPADKSDILSLLVHSNDFTDHELAEQVLTMMAAGHETTSSALSWCAYLLALHPETQSKVRDEVRANLPSPSSDETITAEQIDKLTWLNAVCLEVVRLYPTVPVTIREVVNETPLGGKVLPKGTQVLLAPWAINRSQHFWGKDANEFKPERWIHEDGVGTNKTGGSTSNYAQLTFLHGPRSCIGQGFAQSELKCLLAAFVGRYQFELAREGKEYFPAGLVTTKPSGGMWLRMKAVDGW